MFSSRKAVFAPGKPRGSLGRFLGVMLVLAIVFAAGVYTGRNFPQLFSSPLSAPVTAAEF